MLVLINAVQVCLRLQSTTLTFMPGPGTARVYGLVRAACAVQGVFIGFLSPCGTGPVHVHMHMGHACPTSLGSTASTLSCTIPGAPCMRLRGYKDTREQPSTTARHSVATAQACVCVHISTSCSMRVWPTRILYICMRLGV